MRTMPHVMAPRMTPKMPEMTKTAEMIQRSVYMHGEYPVRRWVMHAELGRRRPGRGMRWTPCGYPAPSGTC